MSQPIIQARNLSKRYRLGQSTAVNRSFGEMLYDHASALFRKNQNTNNINRHMWALKDINFDINPGEVVGIIGKNGAGKSTLLKILSRITDPTNGSVHLRGRVASLLEVGTGFHPELTGRENIFLNGSILGMTRTEIKSKLDEIVAFSGVEKFLDTPVKRYSSGMSVRLAFSVAAHLEPEILVIDEVLAVGDATFQKRCLGKLDQVANSGRTVLFVSHNMAAVQKLCTRALFIHNGQLQNDGPTEQIIDQYLTHTTEDIHHNSSLEDRPRREKLGKQARITNCRILNHTGSPEHSLKFGESFSIELTIKALHDTNNISMILGIDAPLQGRIITSLSEEAFPTFTLKAGESYSTTLNISHTKLLPGQYTVTPGIRSVKGGLDQIENAISFQITDALHNENEYPNGRDGIVYCPPAWTPDPNINRLVA